MQRQIADGAPNPRFTIDRFDPEDTWSAVRFGSRWNGWETPVVKREVLEAVVAAAEGETLTYIGNAAVISGDEVHPEPDGTYDLGQLGWCFTEAAADGNHEDEWRSGNQ